MSTLGSLSSTTEMRSAIPVVQYSAPTTGSTVTVNSNGHVKLLLNPSGSLLALTVTLPSTPTDGDIVSLASSQAVTTLTMNGGTIIGALTTLAIATFASYIYSGDASKWFRVG
jgi:hypothetical protein